MPISQRAMYDEASRRIAEGNETFLEMVHSPNPITKSELRALIKRRPTLWGRFAAFLHTDALKE